MNVKDKVNNTIYEYFGVYPTDDATFDSLGLDIYDKIELFQFIEEEYAINFPDDVFNNIVSVKGLIVYIENEIR